MIKTIEVFVLGLVIGLLVAFMFWQNAKTNALQNAIIQNANNHAQLVQDLNKALNPPKAENSIPNQ